MERSPGCDAGHCLLPLVKRALAVRCAVRSGMVFGWLQAVAHSTKYRVLGTICDVLLIQRVEQHVEADAGGVLLGVAAAADALVAFERAADVERREDDGPAAFELDAFELRFDLADARGNGLGVVGDLRVAERDVADVVAAVGGGEEFVAGGNGLELFAGKAAASSWRNDSVKDLLAQIESASSVPPRSRYSRRRWRSASVRWNSWRPCMKTMWYLNRLGSLMLISSGAARTWSFSSPCVAVRSRFSSAPGASLQPPPWRSLAMSMTARGDPVAEATSPCGRVEGLFFAFGFAVGGVGEDVDADRQRVGDVFGDIGRVASPLAGAGQFPVARKIFGAVDDAGAAAVFDALQAAGVGRIGADDVLHAPDRMTGRRCGCSLYSGSGKTVAMSWRKATLNRPESLQQASAKMKPPRST